MNFVSDLKNKLVKVYSDPFWSVPVIYRKYVFWPTSGHLFEILINAIDFLGELTPHIEVSASLMKAFLMLKIASSFQAAANHSPVHLRTLFFIV